MKSTHIFRFSLWVIVFLFLNTCQNISAQTWQTVFELERTIVNQDPINRIYTVPSGGPFRYRITVRGGNGGATAVPTGTSAGGRGGVFTSEFDLASGWTLDCVAGSNGVGTDVLRYGCGGGGSSGIYIYTPGFNGPLIVAGGGGGSGGGFVFSNYAGGDAGSYSNPGSGGGGGAGSTGIYPSPNDWGGGGGAGLSGNGGLNNYGYGGVLHTAGGGRGGASIIHPNFTSRVMLGGGGFTGGGGGSSLFASAGGGGGGYSGGGGGGNGFNESIPDGYGGGGGTSFISTLGYNTSAFSHAAYTSVGGTVKVEILVRTSDFGTIIPTGIPNDLVFEFNQLEALYKATNGTNWTNKTNWLTGSDMSQWHGVTLTADGKSVLKIELPSNNLNNLINGTTNTLPDLNLPELTTLSLNNNAIRGTIPNFNYLPQLQTLHLFFNQLSGSLPNFANCTTLQYLNVVGNQLTGAVPNFLDYNWLSIDLGLNQLSGTMPSLSLGLLQFFSVHGNQLSGQIPNLIMPALQTIHISSNNFSGTLPPILNENSIGFAVPNGYYHDNNYNFGSLAGSPLLNGTGTVKYAPQKNIAITLNAGLLEVNTGIPHTDLSQDYYWYKDNAAMPLAVTKVNWFRPPSAGVYRVEVKHNVLTNNSPAGKTLILVSNDFTVSTVLKSNGGRTLPHDLPNCLVDDFNELEKIYDATAGASWTTQTNWFTSGNIASWHGVWGMSADGCNVADLVLNSNNLNGVLPNLSFPNATRLSFANNLLRGGIPTITAPNLKILGFGTNQMSGEIPNFSFTLDELYLNNNKFIFGDMLDDLATKSWINTPVLQYRDQSNIPISFANCVLTVNTGVVDATQTFIWFKKNADNSLTEVARTNNGQFTPSVAGIYVCHAYHLVLTRSDIPVRNLILVSEEHNQPLLNTIVHVKPTASGNGSGDSWANATTFQNALETFDPCVVAAIWLAAGIYSPTKDVLGIPGSPLTTFYIKNKMKIYGGFVGTETQLSQRPNPFLNPSIISGGSSGITSVNDDNTTLLDGLTIRNGYALDGTIILVEGVAMARNGGGGLKSLQSSLVVRNVIFENNDGFYGGAVECRGNAATSFINCVFTGNRGEYGSGVYSFGSFPTFTNCLIVNNSFRNTIDFGSAIYMNNSGITLTNCNVFNNNIYIVESTLGARNSLFANVGVVSSTNILNIYSTNSQTNLSLGVSSNVPITATAFVNTALPKGADGIWLTDDDGLQLGCGSPAFNAGTATLAPTTDILGNSRSQLGSVDIGPYESTRDLSAFTASIAETGTSCGAKTFAVSTTPPLGVGGLYAWSGGTTHSVATNTFNTSGTYSVTVTNTAGCTATTNTTTTIAPPPTRLYVNVANTNPIKDGLTWTTAFDNLQNALSACKASGAEIWVARGTYKPSADATGNTSPSDNRKKTFSMPSNVLIYGGFAGTETNLSERTPSVRIANPTILSGDFSNDDAVTGNGNGLVFTNYTENVYHVVTANSQTGTSRLDGFTISGGNANLADAYFNYGGGVLSLDGGANFTLANCILTKNRGELGGGMGNVGNAASQIVNCVFEKNYAFLHGGALTNYLSTPTFSNCVFTGNWAQNVGSVMYNLTTANATLNNCTLVGNVASNTSGGTIYNDGSFPTISNSIIWANTPSVAFAAYITGAPTVNYSIVQGGHAGTNNTATDPIFTNINNPIGSDNQWFTTDDGLQLACGSPAYNTGTTTSLTTDFLGTSRPQFSTNDIGAYESITDRTAPTISIIGTTTACGSVNLTASGGATYAWSGGTTPSVASNRFTNSGTYTVTATAVNGCSATQNATVTVLPAPMITFTDQIINCIAATVTANGGDTYAWSGGAMPSAARNSFTTTGTYTVTVTNTANGCSNSQNITLNLPTDAARLYVNAANSNPFKDGLTWATALTEVQTALETCNGVANREIWVAAGTYKPTKPMITGGTSRQRTFLLSNGIKIYGGFVGTETNLSQRTPSVIAANPTILSGDLNGDDVVSGSGTNLTIASNSENVYSVVLAINCNATTILDGLTITGGTANIETTTTVQGQPIYSNSGGGMYQLLSSVTLNRVVFKHNSAAYGGGLYCSTASPTVTNCVFDRNITSFHGAGMMSLYSAVPQLSNCVFNGGRAFGVGSAIYNLNSVNQTIKNSNFTNNHAPANGGVIFNDGSTVNLHNSILWNNPTSGNFGTFGFAHFNVTYTSVEGFLNVQYDASNNTNNPLFKNINDPDGIDNQWFTADDGLQLSCGSPSFNTGTNTGAPATDILENARPQFSTTDRGAYESTVDLVNPITGITFSGATTVCQTVNLTASAAPAGTYTYAWSGGSTPSVASNTFTTSGTYSVTSTNANGCTATASQTVTVLPQLVPSVSIAVSPSNNIAAATNATFTATPTNGGSTPQYQWYLNNNLVGTNSPTYTNNSWTNGDEIKCVMTSNFDCLTTPTATSNTIKLFVCQSGVRLYVKPTASGTGDGSSWANATNSLYSAFNNGCNIKEIWVAGGIYQPTHNENGVLANDNTRVFALPNGVQLYGSFAGTETSLSQRTPSVMMANPTVLSGDFGNDDVVSGTGSSLSLLGYGNNAFHIIAIHEPTTATRLDGFTITGGSGGGGNVFSRGLGNHGGGIWVYGASTFVTIANCIISKNGAVYGGGMMNINSSPSLNNCIFDRNSASLNYGGGVYNHTNSRPAVTNCVFSGNYARIVGGGISNFNNSSMTMINSTMSGNYAQAGGGFYNDNSDATITSSIIWSNTADGLNNYQSTPTITYSTLQTTFTGTGISTTDPAFINAADPDGVDNQWFTADDGLQLACNSPARDAGTNTGTPTTDLLNNATFNSQKDMGAYEKQDNNGCPIFVGTAACQSVTINGVSGNRAYNFFINNQLIATLNPNGQNLGNVTVEIGDPSGVTTASTIKYLGRHINVTSTIAPTTNYTLCLYYKDSELTEYNTATSTTTPLSNLNMAWKEGSIGCDWTTYIATNSGEVINASIIPVDYGVGNDGFYLQFNLNHFTLFAPTAASTPLPVELINFNGDTEGDINHLYWQTASENNTQQFDIQRLVKGTDFETIGTIAAQNKPTHYDFMDKNLIKTLHFYRLKIVDFDGKYAYSKIIQLENQEIPGNLKVYPNPISEGAITIEIPQHTEGVTIFNTIGQMVFQQQVKDQNMLQVDISTWAQGIYCIKTSKGIKGVKFVKN